MGSAVLELISASVLWKKRRRISKNRFTKMAYPFQVLVLTRAYGDACRVITVDNSFGSFRLSEILEKEP